MKNKDLNNVKGTRYDLDIKKEKGIIKYRVHPILKEDTPGNKRKEVIPYNKNVPAHDTVVDENGNIIQIALVKRVNSDDNVRLAPINFGIHNQGYIMIDPKHANAREIQLYKYLESTDYNGSKKDRDATKEIFFVREDAETNAKMSIGMKKLIHESEGYIHDADDRKIGLIAEKIGRPEMVGKHPDIQRDALLSYCKENPVVVKNLFEAEDVEKEQLLKRAAGYGILENVKAEGAIKYQGETVFTYTNNIGVKPYKEMVDFLMENDTELFESIKANLEVKESEEEEKELSKNKNNPIE